MRQLQNLLEVFWSCDTMAGTNCPNCDKNVRIKISFTAKHVRLDCPSCNKVFFYRRVSLGAIE